MLFYGTYFFGYRESNVNCNMLWLFHINWFNLIGYITEVRQKFSCNVISIFLNLSKPDLVEQRPFFTQPWRDMKGGTSSKMQGKNDRNFLRNHLNQNSTQCLTFHIYTDSTQLFHTSGEKLCPMK